MNGNRLIVGLCASLLAASAGGAGVIKPKCSVRYDAGDPRGGPTAASPDPSKWPSNVTDDFGDLFDDRLNIFVEVPELGTTLDDRASETARRFAALLHRRRTLDGSKPDHFSLWLQNIAGKARVRTLPHAAVVRTNRS